MNEIIIRDAGKNQIELKVNGDIVDLVRMLMNAMNKEPQLSALILTALTMIAKDSNKSKLN